MDRTFFHSKFVHENLTKNQLNDVRILKKFFKSNYSYGDKAPTGRMGFIGYACELMIYHFGNIWSVFENFNILYKIPIDINKRTELQLRNLERLRNDFLLIMDPTDKNRNVASSISPRSWIYCNKRINDFVLERDINIILKKDIDNFPSKNEILNTIQNKLENYVILEYEQINEDHYTKLRDKSYSLAETAKSHSKFEQDGAIKFKDVDYIVYFKPKSKVYTICFYTSTPQIEKEYLRKGPKANNNKNHQKFLENHPDAFEEDGFLCIYEKREYNSFINFIKSIIKMKKIKEMNLLNISHPNKAQTQESLKGLILLNKCILPYNRDLTNILTEIDLLSEKKHR